MNDATHLNQDVLLALKDIMEDNFQLLITTFIKDSKQRIVSMHQALVAADTESFRLAAHSLKGSSSNLGAEKLRSMSMALEQMAVTGVLDGAEAQLLALEKEFKQVTSELDAYL